MASEKAVDALHRFVEDCGGECPSDDDGAEVIAAIVEAELEASLKEPTCCPRALASDARYHAQFMGADVLLGRVASLESELAAIKARPHQPCPMNDAHCRYYVDTERDGKEPT